MPEVPDEETPLLCVVTIFQLPLGDLAAAPLVVWVLHGVLLQDLDAVPPVNPVEVVTDSASGAGQPWTPWKGALMFVSFLVEFDLIELS